MYLGYLIFLCIISLIQLKSKEMDDMANLKIEKRKVREDRDIHARYAGVSR